MFVRIPKVTSSANSPSYDLLRDALAQYDTAIGDNDGQRQLQSLNVDDIDLVEAIQLVERALKVKIDMRALRPSTTVADVVGMLDGARDARQR